MKKLPVFVFSLLPLIACTFSALVFAAEPEVEAENDELGPEMILDDWDWIERDLALEVEKELNTNVPRYKDGDPIVFTLLGGVTEKGSYNWASTNYVLIITKTDSEKKIDFDQLSFDDRIKCDSTIRAEYVSIESAVQTRNALIENEVQIPGMVKLDSRGRPTKVRIDYTKNPAPLENFEELFYYADPRAIYEMGDRFLRGEGVPKDPTFAFLYYRMAANNGNVFAMFKLGMLYFQGIGIAQNKPVALQLISTASSKGHRGAKEFLSKYKVSLAQKKKAQEEYAKKLSEYTAKSQKNADRYAAMLASKPTLQQGRTDKRFDGRILRRTNVNSSNRNNNNRNRR